ASQYRASVLCAPNFGYAYYLKHFSDEENQSLNLSSVRIIYNGAEPISEPLCNEFTRRLVRYGLSCTAMRPVYGLAEATLAVSMSKLDDLVLTSVPDIPSAASEGK